MPSDSNSDAVTCGEKPSKDLPSGAERKATLAQFEMSREKNEDGNNQ